VRRALPPLLLALLLLVACGGADDAADGGAGATALAIAVWPAGEGAGAAVTATLTCDPAGGDLTDPAAACAALEAEADALEPVPPDTACTLLYGGPEQARITGTIDGEPVEAVLSRVDGCQIDRWERLRPLLPAYEPVPL
jgi:hypothetical protein